MRNDATPELHHDRPLSEGYPGLEELALEYFSRQQSEHSEVPELLAYLSKLVALPAASRAVIVGCGPRPGAVRDLLANGFDAFGVEPVASFAAAGREFLGDSERVREGAAESLPFADASCDVVVCESVLEHVESPRLALSEIYRILKPGRFAYLTTTNRYRVSLRGENGEYTVPYFNWFPALVKESYVHDHLHFRPELANYSTRPAVHWFSYAELCHLGRDVGFARFYSKIDLADDRAPAIAGSRLRRLALHWVRRNPWLRSAALLQYGASIFMMKRP